MRKVRKHFGPFRLVHSLEPCPQSNMVSLLVDFGFFGPFLSPFCDGSFLEAVGPRRLWANKCSSTAHSKAPGNENHEHKETAHGSPLVNLMDILTPAFWQSLGLYMSLLDVLPVCTFVYVSKDCWPFCTGSFQRLPVRG